MKALAFAAMLGVSPAAAGELLYFQDFERPNGYVNDLDDTNGRRTVNDNYGDDPPGFRFAQRHTVETLNISGSARGRGSAAFGRGYRDPSGWGGNFAIGMLSDVQDDRLGLAFHLRGHRFLNLVLDISSIDVTGRSRTFVPEPVPAPLFTFTVYAATSGTPAIAGTRVLDRAAVRGTASPRDTFDWTSHKIALDATGAGGGWVVLQIDLVEGGYAAFDNLRIIASESPEDFGRPLKRPKR